MPTKFQPEVANGTYSVWRATVQRAVLWVLQWCAFGFIVKNTFLHFIETDCGASPLAVCACSTGFLSVQSV